MIERWRSPRLQFLLSLLAASMVSIGLFLYSAWRRESFGYSYMIWNLTLAWLPLILALRLMVVLKYKLWSSWEALGTSVLWLLFLPNSFYMISDFIHLRESSRADVLYDAVMFTSFIYTGVILGFVSLYLVHLQLKRRLDAWASRFWLAGVLLLCSIAIFIGRDLRWNSWDVLINPGGLLFDISDRLQHLGDYPNMLLTIAVFFVLLTSMYGLLWQGSKLLKAGLDYK
jgi:uncharacterized membrane protein